jgi:predicted nucleic acid-binding protein
MRNGAGVAIVDAGPLYAAVDADDSNHEIALEALGRPRLRHFIPAMVVTEVCYLIGRHLGARVEAQFLALSYFRAGKCPARTRQPRVSQMMRVAIRDVISALS